MRFSTHRRIVGLAAASALYPVTCCLAIAALLFAEGLRVFPERS